MSPSEVGRSSWIDVDGIRLRVSEEGRGRPLLLIMGLGGHLGMWRPLRDQLPGVATIAYDGPGTGSSATTPLPLSMGGLARLVTQLLDQLGHDQVDVLGLSMGGAIAQELARRSPERVGRLVLVATGPGLGGVPGNLFSLAELANPLRFFSRRYFEAVAPTLYGGRARDHDVARRHARSRISAPPTVRGYAWQLSALLGWSSVPWLHEVPHPTLVLAGDDDPLVPVGNAELMARRLPRAELVVLEGEGHLVLAESPERAGQAILRFLSPADPVGGRVRDDGVLDMPSGC